MTREEAAHLRDLEESLWRAETRFNLEYMGQILAPDFVEFGRSGRVYQRQDTLDIPGQAVIDVQLPLANFNAQLVSAEVALVIYISEVVSQGVKEFANRSSLWRRSASGWQILFHQGTPFGAAAHT